MTNLCFRTMRSSTSGSGHLDLGPPLGGLLLQRVRPRRVGRFAVATAAAGKSFLTNQ